MATKITYNNEKIAEIENGQVATLACRGKKNGGRYRHNRSDGSRSCGV